ncbi:RNA processing factor [Lithospermum erythrorhizon]|uniref:RNA processing factor n=1 Tax=Lithospermum erythrorhizon TaxID=34254 RepID=A0AAV3QJX3_LITER
MPRTTTLECPGCPPLRALTFDVLGLIKVIEARDEDNGAPKVVERWGEPDSSKCVLAASFLDREVDPLLAVARTSGMIEVLSPINGDVRVSIRVNDQTDTKPSDDVIVGLHMFKRPRLESVSRLCSLLTCTTRGQVSITNTEVPQKHPNNSSDQTPTTWNVSGSGNVLCAKVDGSENYASFGGKGVEINLWDLQNSRKIFSSKSVTKSSIGIFTPPWFTSATFLSHDDHRKIVAGTNNHQVHLYDISAQRKPVMTFNFRETAIKAVSEDPDGHTIFIGNGSGDLASVDTRTGKLLGCFLGKCSGSIRSIARHPEVPVIASCGLDSYVRLWDVESRQLLSAVFLKQHLNCVVFDSYFDEKVAVNGAQVLPHPEDILEMSDSDEPEVVPVKRKKAAKAESGSKKSKSKRKEKKLKGESDSD